jgi:hypothetical protein
MSEPSETIKARHFEYKGYTVYVRGGRNYHNVPKRAMDDWHIAEVWHPSRPGGPFQAFIDRATPEEELEETIQDLVVELILWDSRRVPVKETANE